MTDHLASWHDTATKAAIVDFVEGVRSGADAVPPEERIAVFDNDRTRWTHDDSMREFDYVKGAERVLEAAKTESWTVVSVKDDWASVFADR
jgi:hypothetical protein